jgi:hypothetical protein
VKRYGKYGRKVAWIVKIYGQCGRKVCRIVKWYGKYGRKASWIVNVLFPVPFQTATFEIQRLKYQLVVFLVHDVIKHFIFSYKRFGFKKYGKIQCSITSCTRKVGWIVKRFGKYRRKVSWKVKRYGNYGRKVALFTIQRTFLL